MHRSLIDHSKLSPGVIVSANGSMSMWLANNSGVYYPKTAGIGSYMPTTLVRMSRSNNVWMDEFFCLTRRCSQSQCFDHMPNGLNAPVSNYRYTKTAGVFCNLVHGCALGPPACHHCEAKNKIAINVSKTCSAIKVCRL